MPATVIISQLKLEVRQDIPQNIFICHALCDDTDTLSLRQTLSTERLRNRPPLPTLLIDIVALFTVFIIVVLLVVDSCIKFSETSGVAHDRVVVQELL